MPITLTVHAKEESTYLVTADFTNEQGKEVTPNEVLWTLIDPISKAIINSRQNVSETPAASVDILLSGDDLAFLSGEANQAIREIKVEATYDSDLGTDLPLRNSARILVDEIDY